MIADVTTKAAPADGPMMLPSSHRRRAWRIALGTCWLVLLCACGARTPPLPALGKDAVILAFGDSLTFGTGARPNESYPAQLQQLIGRNVVMSGVPGEISEDGLRRLPETLDEVQPQLLILCHGGNDFLRRLDEKKTATHLRAMVQLARQRHISVLMIAPPKPGLTLGLTLSPPDFYTTIAGEFAIPIESSVLGEVLTDRALKSDLVHPNAAGYRRIAVTVADFLKKTGAI